jgi:hypothetical protein
VASADRDGATFPTAPVGDAVAIAAEVFAKYTGPAPPCAGYDSGGAASSTSASGRGARVGSVIP